MPKRKPITVARAMWQGARDSQQDHLIWDDSNPTTVVACLADGMGGHQGGELASAITANAALNALTDGKGGFAPRLRKSLHAANESIANHVSGNPELKGMGSTLICARIRDDEIRFASVGDSQLYLIRDGALQKLNADHSLKPVLARMVADGDITAEDAANDPKRHSLRSAITGKEIPLIDLPEAPVPLQSGDVVLIASDGLDTLGEVERPEGILSALQGGELQARADGLIEAIKACAKQNQDNCAILLAEVP